MSENKVKWPKLGTLRSGTSPKGNKYSYIKLEDNIKILVDGVEAEMNDKLIVRLQDPRDTVDRLEQRGIIDEATANSRRAKLDELDWLKYELVLPPSMSKNNSE